MDPTTGQDKVYSNETISDTPFPNNTDATTVTDTTNSGTSNTPAGNSNIPSQSLPLQVQAQELLSTSLNTRTKKIIQEFQFTPSGAIQIGELEIGISGDIRISPNGIIARNMLGDTTVAIDGDTGDAIFAGKIQSGAQVTGNLTVTDGGYILLYDDQGIPSIFIGEIPS